VELFDGIEAVPPGYGPSAVTVGKFDGVHLGHRAVIARLRALATERGLSAVAMTFDRHPLAFHAPDACPVSLVSLAQKLDLLAHTGLDATVLLRYDAALASVTAEEFVRDHLVGALGARALLVGRDFRYGAGNTGDVALLERLAPELGFEVIVVDDVVPEDDRKVSSTWIRELLGEGRVREAGELLGRPPVLRSTVVHGERLGRELGFPTANLDPAVEGFIPLDGVYATWATIDGVRYPAATSIGNNPTFEGVPEHRIEAHLIDATVDAYDRTIELEFVDRLRGMVRFDSVDALISALAADVARVRELLA